MKIVFISHPVSSNPTQNIKRIRNIIRRLNLAHNDIVPFAPYFADLHALDDNNPIERARGIANNTALITRAVDEVWLFGDHISKGMAAEIELARTLNIPVVSKSAHINYQPILTY